MGDGKEKSKVHGFGSRRSKDWDGIGTHPDFGPTACGVEGCVTDCISDITCPKCRLHFRKEGKSNDWLEKEWSRIDAIIGEDAK